jgi:anhydro-N-acetylmuramic acid kinase
VLDVLHTAVEHIADQISSVIHHATPHDNHNLLVTGGGYFNSYLLARLQHKLTISSNASCVKLATSSDHTVNFKEALIFAFLGLRTLLALPNIASSVTGASRDCVGGSIHLPGLDLNRADSSLALFR